MLISKFTISRIFLIVLFSFQVFFIHAQTGIITGIVKDKKTGETIVGVNAIIQGTNTGSSSDLNGKFSIPNLKKGSYNLVVSFISYKTLTIENVKVSSDKETILNIELEESVSSIEGVTVSARRMTNTDLSLLSSIKKADVVVSGISAQQISRSQDRDAAEVVKRIPGVTIINNRFIMIRGLSERYNAVNLNEANAPGMEADVRSFSFDIVPSSLIDRIMIYKSPSAELPGDFAGGTVKIYTKSIPEETMLEFGISTGFRTGSSLKDYFGADQGSKFQTGFNNGKYDLPSGFPSNLREVDNIGLIDAGRSLPNEWVPEKSNTGLGQGAVFSGAFRMKAGKVLIGNISSVNYGNDKSIFDVQRYDYNQYDAVNQKSSFLYDFNDRQYKQNVKLGLLHNWSFRFNPSHIIEFKNLYNQLSQSEYVLRTGVHYDFNYVPDNHSFDQVYRGIYSGQLSGKHQFIEGKMELEWVAAYGTSYRDEPDYRRYRSDVDTITGNKTLYIPVGAAASYFLGRFYSEMNENTWSGNVALTYRPMIKSLPNLNPVIKMGVLSESKERSFKARNIGYTTASTVNFDSGLQFITIDSLFHPNNINNSFGIRIDEQSNPSDSYDAENKQLAAWLSVNLSISRQITLISGVRMENNKQSLSSFSLSNTPVEVENNTMDILPSLNLSYNFNERTLIRAAWGMTLNRPEFRELAPFGFYDFNYNLVKKGNPDLKNASINNIDLRWEYYPTPNEIVTAGLFYKIFTNPIETLFIPGGGSGGIKDFSFGNAKSARSMGIEVEIRKSLAGLTSSKLIDDISLLFNASIIDSKIKLGEAAVRQSENRPMQGQSPYIINAGVFYKNMKSNLQINALYNVIGKRIFAIGYDVYPDIYEMPRNQLDLTVTKGFGEHFEIKAGISDMLNNEFVLLQNANDDGKFDKTNDQIIQRYKQGSLITFGIKYKL